MISWHEFTKTIDRDEKNLINQTHQRLGSLHFVVDGFNQAVNILSTPVILAEGSTQGFVRVIGSIVWEDQSTDGIRIEVVIDVDTVDVVSAHNVLNNVQSVLADFFAAWVHKDVTIVVVSGLWESIGHVV